MNYPTRRAKAYTALLEHPQGISGREIDIKYLINSGRNEVAELMSKRNVHLNKTSQPTAQGAGYFSVYQIPNKTEALKVIQLLNLERSKCNIKPIDNQGIEQMLARFKSDENPTAEPKQEQSQC